MGKIIMDINIKNDLRRYTSNLGKISFLKHIIIRPQFRYMYIKRKCNKYRVNNKKIMFNLFRLLLKRYQVKFGIEIPYETNIDGGFYIGHIGGIVINAKSKIGKNVNILNGVLIGYEPRGERKGCPIIGNNVWIGTNSVIVGNINIGNNVLIAPNSFVNFSVPNNSIVIGNPAKVIERIQDPTLGYINNKI